MNMNKILLFCCGICFITFISCRHQSVEDTTMEPLLTGYKYSIKKYDIESIEKENREWKIDPKIVILEMTEDALISNIQKLATTEEYIFILDEMTKHILKYTQDGKFVSLLNKKGKSPEEYLSLSDFMVDEENKRIEVLDMFSNRLISYDFDWNFVSSKQLPVASSQISRLGNEYVICSHRMTLNNGEDYILYALDTATLNINHKFMSFDPERLMHNLVSKTPLIPASGGVGYLKGNSKRIFSYHNGMLEPYFVFNYQEEMTKKEDSGVFDMENINMVYENSKYIKCVFVDGRCLYFDKSNQTGYSQTSPSPKEESFILRMGTPVGVSGEQFIEWIPAQSIYSLLNVMKLEKQEKIEQQLFGKETIEELRNLTKEDNPVLLFYTLNL